MLKIALVGRPNVGKSTFFNSLINKKKAIVSNVSGLTQDRQYAIAKLADLVFELIDTAGVDDLSDYENINDFQLQTKKAIEDADLLLFMTDASSGIMPTDHSISKVIRKFNKKIIHVANKSDKKTDKFSMKEAIQIGFGDVLLISSEHKLGFNNLYYSLSEFLKRKNIINNEKQLETQLSNNSNQKIKVSFIGKPNTGKSTLINNILGQTRLVTGKKPGLTKDSIETIFTKGNIDFILTDTAGIRKKSSINNSIEKKSVNSSFFEIRKSDVCILIIDSTMKIQKQDLLIANQVLTSGKSLIIALNKWDLILNKSHLNKQILEKIKISLSQIKDVNLVPIAGINGFGVPKLIDKILKIYELTNTRITTSKLNKWLVRKIYQFPPPLVNGKSNSLKYISQIKNNPASFLIFCSYPKKIPKSYLRFIENSLRRDFNFSGLPIRILFKTSQNPYSVKKQ